MPHKAVVRHQAWVSLPKKNHAYGGWYYGTPVPVGTPQKSKKRALAEFRKWKHRKRNKIRKLRARIRKELGRGTWEPTLEIRTVTWYKGNREPARDTHITT